jgi:fructose-1,6-bisphosphatase
LPLSLTKEAKYIVCVDRLDGTAFIKDEIKSHVVAGILWFIAIRAVLNKPAMASDLETLRP